MDVETLKEILHAKPELDGLPIVADASFGHTTPAFTFPIGGTGKLLAHSEEASFRIESH